MHKAAGPCTSLNVSIPPKHAGYADLVGNGEPRVRRVVLTLGALARAVDGRHIRAAAWRAIAPGALASMA